jgi:ribosomal protein S12 methylthiotransferase
LVDSERIITALRSEGYELSPDYQGADAVIVNTCGFMNTAKAESLDAIGEAMQENGRVIVTGCMSADETAIRETHPGVLAVTGPQQYEQVIEAVHAQAPPPTVPFSQLVPEAGLRLTPRHYAYLKISEGCNHDCQFCVIPSMRGKLTSRPAAKVVNEAERLVEAGVQELLVISQDTSVYGADVEHASTSHRGKQVRAHITDLAEALGGLGVWVRLHHAYPHPHIDSLIPLMAEEKIIPYIDVPFQHASPSVLKAMRRPARQESDLRRIADWRRQVPDLTIRATFMVGFPGETEEDFVFLLEWLQEAQLDRVSCFRFEPVKGAAANDLPDHVPEEVKEERWHRLMAAQAEISEARMKEKIGWEIDVLIDEVDEEGAIGRSMADAPEIDGCVFLMDETELAPGDMVRAEVVEADHYDLWARLA